MDVDGINYLLSCDEQQKIEVTSSEVEGRRRRTISMSSSECFRPIRDKQH